MVQFSSRLELGEVEEVEDSRLIIVKWIPKKIR